MGDIAQRYYKDKDTTCYKEGDFWALFQGDNHSK